MKTQQGECYDSNGVPIYPGDLLRSVHFRDRRRKIHYLYHTAVWNAKHGTMEMVPTCHLEPTKRSGGGRCWLSPELARGCEVIYGHGPAPRLDYTDRQRRNVSETP